MKQSTAAVFVSLCIYSDFWEQ